MTDKATTSPRLNKYQQQQQVVFVAVVLPVSINSDETFPNTDKAWGMR